MKYLESPTLSRLSRLLTHEGPECSVHTRLEAYSCKNIKRDKKLFKSLETAYHDDITNSPPIPSWLGLDREAEITPFGPMDKHSSRKTLYLLIATLNIAFPDHEFSDVRPSHFNKESSGASVLNALSSTLISPHRAGSSAPRTYSSYPPGSTEFFPNSVSSSSSPYTQIAESPNAPPPIVAGTHPSVYAAFDDVISLSECEVFSYSPGTESDPHANDFSDDEDDVASVEEEYTSTDDDDSFEFDNYDIDEQPPVPQSRAIKIPPPTPRLSSEFDLSAYPTIRTKRRGALLWSSQWFFVNRKMKRILFVSIWARAKRAGLSPEDEENISFSANVMADNDFSSERFVGWEGGIGAGARALGLAVA